MNLLYFIIIKFILYVSIGHHRHSHLHKSVYLYNLILKFLLYQGNFLNINSLLDHTIIITYQNSDQLQLIYHWNTFTNSYSYHYGLYVLN